MDNESTKLLEEAIMWRAQAKMLEDEAKALRERANNTIGPIMALNELTSWKVEGVGTITEKVSLGRSINRDRLVESLVLQGMSPDKVDEVISASSSTWSRRVIEFRIAK